MNEILKHATIGVNFENRLSKKHLVMLYDFIDTSCPKQMNLQAERRLVAAQGWHGEGGRTDGWWLKDGCEGSSKSPYMAECQRELIDNLVDVLKATNGTL